jgi:CubicO group peptidase (beta-lactamase class C family)
MAQASLEGSPPVHVDAHSLGFDRARLERIDAHVRRYVEDGRLPGCHVSITRHGQPVHSFSYGFADKEAGTAVTEQTLWRLYSMTKPVTAVAAMQLYEQGAFSLNDELSTYLPAFGDMRVYRSGPPEQPVTLPATEPIRMWHLLTHTAGLTYGFLRASNVDAMYRLAGSDFAQPAGLDLAGLCDLWATMPLLFEPGTKWNYSVATDVLGRVLEVLTGSSLAAVFQDQLFDPLGMTDTRWWVDGHDAPRLAALYTPMPGTGQAVRYDLVGTSALQPPAYLGGGGGLIGTAADYDRFLRALVLGGEYDGVRVLGRRTLEYMTRNHLPGGQMLPSVAAGANTPLEFHGVGFGLGFAVVADPVPGKVPSTAGEFAWGGAAGTEFWVDPAEGITAAFYTQVLPATTPIRYELRQLVNSALV